MLRRNDLRFFPCCGHQAPSGEDIGFSQESAGALVDGRDGFLGEELFFTACDFQVMAKIILSLLKLERLQMSASNDTRGQSACRKEMEFIEDLILAGKENGKCRFGIEVILHEGVEVAEDFAFEQMSFVEYEDGVLIAGGEVCNGGADSLKQARQGTCVGIAVQSNGEEL